MNISMTLSEYAVRGAMQHGTTMTRASIEIRFPRTCVVFLRSSSKTPDELTRTYTLYDGRSLTETIPVIKLNKLSVAELKRRKLLPIGQFKPRTYEPLTKRKLKSFYDENAELLAALKEEYDAGNISGRTAAAMQINIEKQIRNAEIRSKMEVTTEMISNSLETIPWVNIYKVFEQLEARRDMEIAVNAYRNRKYGPEIIEDILTSQGVSNETIAAARAQVEAEPVGA